jgi:hypothetical protein
MRLVWDACLGKVQEISNSCIDEPLIGKVPLHHKLHKRRSELKKVACSVLGISIISLLWQFALKALINWVINRLIKEVEQTTPSSFKFKVLFDNSSLG